MTPRRFAALFLAVMALGLIVFGVIRGISKTGPAHGVRLVVAIEAPVDDAQRELAQHVVETRFDDGSDRLRVVPAGDQLVVEIGDVDLDTARRMGELLERRGTFELHAVAVGSSWLHTLVSVASVDPSAAAAGVRAEENGLVADDRESKLPIADADAIGCTGRVTDGKRRCVRRGDAVLAAFVAAHASKFSEPDRMLAYGRIGETHTWRTYVLERKVLLDGRAIRSAKTAYDHVVIEADQPVGTLLGVRIAVVFEGVVRFVSTPDQVTGTQLHVPTPGRTEDETFIFATELASMAEAGAVHPLQVRSHDTFSRATGFMPRAWPFLAAALVLLMVAAILWRRSVSS